MRILMKLLLALPLLALSAAAIGCDADEGVEIEREPGETEIEGD